MRTQADGNQVTDSAMNKNDSRRSLMMFTASMLIFGTIGIFRRYIPLPSAFLAFARGILGDCFCCSF